MSKIVLDQPKNNKWKVVEVAIGDLVKVSEWDNIVAKGIVTELTDEIIILSNAEFIDGCYDEFDYSAYKNQKVFTFNLANVASIDVAKFETERLTYTAMVTKTLGENYCGSTKVIMSPMFWNAYRQEVRNSKKEFCQYPIEVDELIDGLYVYAVPNEKSEKHQVTSLKSYCIEYFLKTEDKGLICVGWQITSAFDEELDTVVTAAVTKTKKNIEIKENRTVPKLIYRLSQNKNVINRGVI